MGTKERRERDRQRRREDILAAARTLLSEKGYESTTIDDIARALELAKGTIYLYFESKEEIYTAVVEEDLSCLVGLFFDSYDPAADPLTNLFAALEAGMRFDADYRHCEEIMVFKSMGMTDTLPLPLRRQYDEKMGQIAGHVRRVLDEGIQAGWFRPMDTARTAFLLLGMCYGCSQVTLFTRHSSEAESDVLKNCEEVRSSFHDLIAGSVLKR